MRERNNPIKTIFCLIAVLLFSLGLAACNEPGKGTFFHGALSSERKILIASSSATATGPYFVVQYSLDGTFEKILFDTTYSNRIIRSLTPANPFEFLIATDTVDEILKYNYFDGASSFATNGNFTGNIFNMRRNPKSGEVFAIETLTIESFNSAGARVGNPRIPGTAIGACQMTTAARGLDINSNGIVIVGSQGNDDILFFDVTNPSAPTCAAANTSLGNVDPVAIVAHPDGFVYVAHTNGTDAVVKINGDGSGAAANVWTGLTTSNPTAMFALPDGTLLVALDGTNNIIRIATDGTVLQDPFIQDGFTAYVQDMMITEAP